MKRAYNTFMTLLFFFMALFVIGCGGGDGNNGSNRGNNPTTNVDISITPISRTITLGESVTLSVTTVSTDIIWPNDITEYTQTGNTAVFTPTTARVYDFTVTATADTTKKATARITVNPLITNVTPYDYISIDFPGATSTSIWGLNESGVLTGQYILKNIYYGFRLMPDYTGSNGETIEYNGPDFERIAHTVVNKINNSGKIVGTAQITVVTDTGSDIRNFGFLREPGQDDMMFVNPDTSIIGGTTAHGINDDGWVVGNYRGGANNKPLGFLHDGSTIATFDIAPAGSRDIYYFDINNNGVIAGTYFDANGNGHGFTYVHDTGTITIIDYPGANSTSICGINDSGYVVGFSVINGKTSGFAYDGKGTFTPFDYPNAVATRFTEINNNGQIAGYHSDGNGNDHGLLVNDLVSIP